jgi:hypothetical protein
MPLPPLAASERRLAQIAAVASWCSTIVGLACAFAPRYFLRALSLGGHAPLLPDERLFAAFAGAGFIGVAISLRRTAAAPREQRQGFAPLLWMLASSAVLLGIGWRRGNMGGISAAPLGVLAIGSAMVWLALAYIYVRAAPGVNLGASLAPPAEGPGPKAVQLGVRVAPAPAPLPDEPKAAAAASRG